MRPFLTVVLAGLALLIAAPATADVRTVKVKDDFFTPVARTASPGDVIKFSWVDKDNPHDVFFTKAPRGAKPKKCIERTKGTCKRKVAKAGVYRYVCTIHLEDENMRGRIVVE